MSRLLGEAERAVHTPAGAKEVWSNPRTSSVVMDALKRPASGGAYTQVRLISDGHDCGLAPLMSSLPLTHPLSQGYSPTF